MCKIQLSWPSHIKWWHYGKLCTCIVYIYIIPMGICLFLHMLNKRIYASITKAQKAEQNTSHYFAIFCLDFNVTCQPGGVWLAQRISSPQPHPRKYPTHLAGKHYRLRELGDQVKQPAGVAARHVCGGRPVWSVWRKYLYLYLNPEPWLSSIC